MDKDSAGVNCYAGKNPYYLVCAFYNERFSRVVHPGLVLTEVTRNMPYFMRLGDKILYPLMCLLRKTPLQGASTTIHVATSLECENMGGKYFFHCSAVPAGKAAYDIEDARRLWVLSEKMTKE